MTIKDHDLEIDHLTYQDDNLVHQVRIFNPKVSTEIVVSCRCRTYVEDGITKISPIAPTRDIQESRKLYDDPYNHWEPFTEEDKAKW